MTGRLVRRAAAAFLMAAVTSGAGGQEFVPPVMNSGSQAFDRDCVNYYAQGNDPDVEPDGGMPEVFCTCLAEYYAMQGLGADALDFYARTLSDDLTTFIHEYAEGDAWMQTSFDGDRVCKTTG